jgi:signal recognition particle subunit SRP54
MSKLMKMLPEQLLGGMGMPELSDEQTEQIEAQMKRTEAMIDSMTKQERNNSKIIDASRKTRIAKGSGTTIADVNALLKQYADMRQMMTQMNRSGLFKQALGGMGGGMMNKLGGMFGGGGGMPSMPGMGGGLAGMLGGGMPAEDEPQNRVKKKKRHKKRR